MREINPAADDINLVILSICTVNGQSQALHPRTGKTYTRTGKTYHNGLRFFNVPDIQGQHSCDKYIHRDCTNHHSDRAAYR
jgi:hypothetical protein